MFLDAWASDGKPVLSKTFQGWCRVLGVVSCTFFTGFLVMSDWSHWAQRSEQNDHVFSDVQRALRGWWANYIEMDENDVAKAKSVNRRSAGGEARRSWSFFANDEAQARWAREATGRKE